MTKATQTFTNDVGPVGRLARALVVRSIREQFPDSLMVTAERPKA
jgi:hypothetical protein